MSEQQADVTEGSSDLEEDLEQDELAESSAALDDDQEIESSEEVEEDEDGEIIRTFESDKANERFSEITTKAKQAEQDAAANRAENEALRRRLEAMESAEVPAFDDTGAPKIEDFDYDQDQYQSAVITYESTKAAHNILTQQKNASRQATDVALKNALFENHNQKRSTLSTTVKDLGPVLDSSQLNNQTLGGNATAEAILRSENGAEIEYHIAKNPEIAVRLNNMDQYSAYGEVARISETLKVKPKKSAALPKPVGASPSGGGKTSGFKAVHSAGATFK